MKRFELAFPCHADFSRMKRVEGGRFCDDCQKVVHDLSELGEEAARRLLANTPRERVCVRYVYDANSGQVVFGPKAQGPVIPEHRLVSRIKNRLAIATAIAAPFLVEACGGNNGAYDHRAGDPSTEQEYDPYQDEGEPPLPDAGSEASANGQFDQYRPLDAAVLDGSREGAAPAQEPAPEAPAPQTDEAPTNDPNAEQDLP